jgi:hypothetical protein
MERSNSSGLDRSNSGSLSNTAAARAGAASAKVSRSNSNSGLSSISGSPSKSNQRFSNRSSTTTGTPTLLVILLGLLAVGQIFLVSPPDPSALRSIQQQSQSQTSTSSRGSSKNHNNLIDPTAWKVSHHLAAKDNEILGTRAEPAAHSEDDYETVRINENDSKSSPISNSKKAAATVPTTTVPTATVPKPPVETSDNGDAPTSPLTIMLQQAGLTDISKADLAGLPTLEQLTRQYGNIEKWPIITGMDTCERYRQQVKHRRRYAAPAGMFNTGTNALDFHLEHNLQAMQKWQVPWGKHRMESVRLTHTAPDMEKARKEDALPIVVIRDPLHWMQSMVRYSYVP